MNEGGKDWVRGPRITREAAERLRVLAFQHRIDPCEVVTRLLLGVSLDVPGLRGVERGALVANLGLSPDEVSEYRRQSEDGTHD